WQLPPPARQGARTGARGVRPRIRASTPSYRGSTTASMADPFASSAARAGQSIVVGSVVSVVVAVERDLRDGVAEDLRGPGGVERREVGIEDSQVEGEVGHEETVAGEPDACREEQTHRRATADRATEVAQLRDRLPRGVEDHHVVRLVLDHPDVVPL